MLVIEVIMTFSDYMGLWAFGILASICLVCLVILGICKVIEAFQNWRQKVACRKIEKRIQKMNGGGNNK